MKYITRERFTENLPTILDEVENDENDEGESVFAVLGSNDEPVIYVVTQTWYDELMAIYEEALDD